ncbi:hypothetical protein Hamer_G021110, partial [Homarus americanus]
MYNLCYWAADLSLSRAAKRLSRFLLMYQYCSTYVDKIHLVYQWIPPLRPQALGVLSGRVNTTYEASRDPWAVHRALYIPHPDPSLSGQYSCSVSTFEDEDTRTAHLLVWRPARDVELKYWRPSEYLVNITCSVAGVAPRPEFTLYTTDPNGTRQGVQVRGTNGHLGEDGEWWAGAWGLILWADTEAGSVISCTFTLPGTSHTNTSNKTYHPDLPIITTTTTTPTTTTASELPGRSSSIPQHAPSTTSTFFDLSTLFGAASAARSVQLSPTWSCSCLMYVTTDPAAH